MLTFFHSAWAVLGKPQPEQLSSSSVTYTEAGFQGRITKVQIWARALDVTSEIQKQVRDCRSEPVLYRGLILNWAGYEITSGGVERTGKLTIIEIQKNVFSFDFVYEML